MMGKDIKYWGTIKDLHRRFFKGRKLFEIGNMPSGPHGNDDADGFGVVREM